LSFVEPAGTGASVALLALRPNALAMALPKSAPDSGVAPCGSVPGCPEAELVALARARAARELPREWDGWALRVCAVAPVDFWREAVFASALVALPDWSASEPAALPASALWLAAACASSLPLPPGASVARAEKEVLAGIELPSVNVPVLIAT
jgi:hypothetical protein